MYQTEKNGWWKHWDFILLDLICLQISYIIAFMIRHGMIMPYRWYEYRNMGLIIALIELCASFFLENYKNIVRRGYFEELKKTTQQITVVVAIVLIYLFFTKSSDTYSRSVFIQMWLFAILFTYVVRWSRKLFVRKKMKNQAFLDNIIVVSSLENIKNTISSLTEKDYKGFCIKGIILLDRCEEKEIMEIPVLATGEAGVKAIEESIVDQVFIAGNRKNPIVQKILSACEEMGITTHYDLGKYFKKVQNTIIEEFAGHIVLTSSIKFADARQIFAKRVIDIVGSLIGIILTGILTIFIAPVIYCQSPGPIFFSQIRVGKGGRKFKIYKFRSMYMDAEERKKELMSQNRMKDGMMFKVDFDTRVIGNKILPSGKKKKGIGNFLRVTNLDEFPQFFNVLKGDMSLVGTRPPTIDEWEKYELHHRARLAIKPGITGMWQVSGRSNITDFEEVVKLDTEYIRNWSMALDFRILAKTFLAVIKKEGSI